MGVLPLEFLPGENRETLGLTGTESYFVSGVRQSLEGSRRAVVRAVAADGSAKTFDVRYEWTPRARPTTTAPAASCRTCCGSSRTPRRGEYLTQRRQVAKQHMVSLCALREKPLIQRRRSSAWLRPLSLKAAPRRRSFSWIRFAAVAASAGLTEICDIFAPLRLCVRSAYSFFTQESIQSMNVLYQSTLFCGFETQWPSSGKSSSFDGTFCSCSAVNNCIPCPTGTRKSSSP